LFGASGLVEFDLIPAGDPNPRPQPPTLSLYRRGEFAATLLQCGHCAGQVVAVEREAMKRRLRLVAADLGFWGVEDEPAPAGVRERKAQLVPDERTHLVGSGRKEHGVHSANHRTTPFFPNPYAPISRAKRAIHRPYPPRHRKAGRSRNAGRTFDARATA